MEAHLRKNAFKRDIDLLNRLKELGGQVDYITLQSVLSKREDLSSDYPMSERIKDLALYAKAVRGVYPNVEIGLVDALPSHGKDYREPYRELRDALARQQVNLSYIHLDMPIEVVVDEKAGVTWQKVREVETYVEDELGVNFASIQLHARVASNLMQIFTEAS